MVRAEDNTIFGSVASAKTAECAVCGNPLRFKEEKQESGSYEQAKHCGRIYTIGQSGQATITMARDPEYKKKEDEIIQKQVKAKELRRQGKEEEARKQEDEARNDVTKLNEDQNENNESKTSEQPEREERKTRRI